MHDSPDSETREFPVWETRLTLDGGWDDWL